MKRATRLLRLFLVCTFVFAGVTVGLQYFCVNILKMSSTVASETLRLGTAGYISVFTTNLNVNIEYYNGDEITAEYVNDLKLTATQGDSSLTLTQDDSFTMSVFSAEQLSYQLTLFLPRDGIYHELYVATGSGRISINGIAADNIELSVKSGSVKLSDVDARLKIKSYSGDVEGRFNSFSSSVSVNNSYGSTSLFLPAEGAVSLDFFTTNGSFSGDFFKREYEHRTGDFIITQGENPKKLSVTTIDGDLALYRR